MWRNYDFKEKIVEVSSFVNSPNYFLKCEILYCFKLYWQKNQPKTAIEYIMEIFPLAKRKDEKSFREYHKFSRLIIN